MSDPVTIQRFDFIKTFPWLRIGRALGCALSLQALFIAMIGVLLVDFSRAALVLAISGEARTLDGAVWAMHVPPVQDTLVPLWNLGHVPWRVGWKLLVIGAAAGVVWSFVGVAMCRCTALEFCRDESASFRDSVQHAINRFAAPWGALATPLFGTAMLMVMIAALAVPAFLPAVGGLWLRFLSPIIAILGVGAGFILLVLPVMWPLMIAAVAVDDSDGFDAFSRSFSFVTSHPWMTAGLFAVAGAMIAACAIGIDFGIEYAAGIIPWSAGWLTSETQIHDHLVPAAMWWVRLFARALLTSLFWSLATIIYVFLRQVTDASPLDKMSGFDLPGLAREEYPVVGIPAMNPPTTETPLSPPLSATEGTAE